jgi:electron-transferring-flavoprotein dehydrogenase
VPKLEFPGGALIGCSAGFVNVPRIKGSHTAMKSGMLAAESVFDAVVADRAGDELGSYESTLRSKLDRQELQLVKNAEPAVSKFGGTLGTILAGIDMWMRVLKIGLPITMKHKPTPPSCGARSIADRLSQARWRHQLRPAFLGVPLQHQS